MTKKIVIFDKSLIHQFGGNLKLAMYMFVRKKGDIRRILNSMRRNRLLKFLDFMNQACFLDELFVFSKLRIAFFIFVLSRCPFLELTDFLLSIENLSDIFDEDDYYNEDQLHNRDMVLFLFIKGLIIRDEFDDATNMMEKFSSNYGDELSIAIIRKLTLDANSSKVAFEHRAKIFDFLCSFPEQTLQGFRSVNPELSHSDAVQQMNCDMSEISIQNGFVFRPLIVPDLEEVDIVSFVDNTFPLAQLVHCKHLQCLICYVSFDDSSVVRIMTCCSARCMDPNDIKCVCEECLIRWGTQCNAENPANRFKRGTCISCPNCRHQFHFFPPNL